MPLARSRLSCSPCSSCWCGRPPVQSSASPIPGSWSSTPAPPSSPSSWSSSSRTPRTATPAPSASPRGGGGDRKYRVRSVERRDDLLAKQTDRLHHLLMRYTTHLHHQD